MCNGAPVAVTKDEPGDPSPSSQEALPSTGVRTGESSSGQKAAQQHNHSIGVTANKSDIQIMASVQAKTGTNTTSAGSSSTSTAATTPSEGSTSRSASVPLIK